MLDGDRCQKEKCNRVQIGREGGSITGGRGGKGALSDKGAFKRGPGAVGPQGECARQRKGPGGRSWPVRFEGGQEGHCGWDAVLWGR